MTTTICWIWLCYNRLYGENKRRARRSPSPNNRSKSRKNRSNSTATNGSRSAYSSERCLFLWAELPQLLFPDDEKDEKSQTLLRLLAENSLPMGDPKSGSHKPHRRSDEALTSLLNEMLGIDTTTPEKEKKTAIARWLQEQAKKGRAAVTSWLHKLPELQKLFAEEPVRTPQEGLEGIKILMAALASKEEPPLLFPLKTTLNELVGCLSGCSGELERCGCCVW